MMLPFLMSLSSYSSAESRLPILDEIFAYGSRTRSKVLYANAILCTKGAVELNGLIVEATYTHIDVAAPSTWSVSSVG